MEEQTQSDQIQEKAMRLNIKRNFKAEKGYEYTVRADNIEELKALVIGDVDAHHNQVCILSKKA